MRAPLRFSLPARLVAAAVLAVCGLTGASALWPEPHAAAPRLEAAFVSPAAARAIGARWRETRRVETGRDYAQALLSAGLPNELLSAVARDGLFTEDPYSRALFKAEALLRLYRHSEALEEVSAPEFADNPYAAFIRVRARTAAGGGLDREALAIATRGPAVLAREAWLLRARAALDESDFAAADASFKRASEAGATKARLEPFRIERDIRAGETEQAFEALALRANSLASMAADRGEALPDFEGLRLAAMVAMRAGEGREAARLADRANLAMAGGPDAPLAALAKWMAGDSAQAEAILAAHLRAAPGDWVARDLAAVFAFDSGKAAAGEAHLAYLASMRPRLAAFRQMKRKERAGDYDGAYSSVAGLSGDGPIMGAVATILGAGAVVPLAQDPSDADRALAALQDAGDLRTARVAVKRLLDLRRSAIDLAASAATFAQWDAGDEAAALAFDAAQSADGFFFPVALRARILEAAAREAEALGHLEVFIARHPDHAPARLARASLLYRLDDVQSAAAAFSALEPAVVFADDKAALDYAGACVAAGEPWRTAMLNAANASALSPAQRARILAAAGADAGAAEAYRDALVDDPGSAELAVAYREVMVRLGRDEQADALLAVIYRRRPAEAAPSAANEQTARENANL